VGIIKSKSKYYVAPENAETFDDSDVTTGSTKESGIRN
jgi:hypothetical protein